MKTKSKSQRIEELLSRGVENIYPNRKALEKALRSDKKLRIYFGIDPTGKLHIGHGAILRKLRQLQDFGHDVIILIGDFTATIGDPTGKKETRKMLTQKQVLDYAKDCKKQIRKVLDFNTANIRFLHNEKWTNKLRPIDMLTIASNFTVARLLERDMFQKRIKQGKDINVPEFLYPIFQAYDAVTMNVDMQIGGNDQTFNMLAGRRLMKKMKDKETFVMTIKLLVDTTGKKMGKTEGNIIELDESPKEMYGKIMSWPDSLIDLGFELFTRFSIDEVKKITNPKNAKAKLAREIVTIYHNKKEAEKAEKEFNKIFKEKKLPSNIPQVKIKTLPAGRQGAKLNILDLLKGAKLVLSKAEARRLIEQGAVKIDNKIQNNWQTIIKPQKGLIIQVGKRRFAQLK